MKITDVVFYDGSKEKIAKLGLSSLYIEVQDILLNTKISLEEKQDANGGAEVRKLIDSKFDDAEDWEKTSTGGIDWKKKIRYNRTFMAQIGVEIQVSARSDLLVRDLVHIRNSIQDGHIEVGIIVVPSERMQKYLPDRTPSIKDARKYIEVEFKEAMTYPIVLIAVEHDGVGEPIKKQKRKS